MRLLRKHINCSMAIPTLRDKILGGNTAMIALAELSLDIESGGALHENKVLRHASTHRFVVVHDIGDTPSRESPFVEHYGVEDFKKSLIRALQLTRAALLYFVDMVGQNEQEKNADGELAVTMLVPQHHEIRGEDDE
jgi:LA2681-like HEPN